MVTSTTPWCYFPLAGVNHHKNEKRGLFWLMVFREFGPYWLVARLNDMTERPSRAWLLISWQPESRENKSNSRVRKGLGTKWAQGKTLQSHVGWQPHPIRSHLPKNPLSPELINGVIHWWDWSPYDPVTFQKPISWQLSLEHNEHFAEHFKITTITRE